MIINIDKPIGWTSFDVVKKVKNITKHKKVGHGGTLDPFASGVLVLGTEEDTKQLQNITNCDKSYIADLQLGKLTNTLDTEGEIIKESAVPRINKTKISKVLDSFLGTQKQRPPMFSAKKQNGVRLYKLARKKIEVQRDEVEIVINNIFLMDFSLNKLVFNVSCSKGTYIRVLGSDIAIALGTVGHLINLKRTRVGNFLLKDSVSIKQFNESWKSAAI